MTKDDPPKAEPTDSDSPAEGDIILKGELLDGAPRMKIEVDEDTVKHRALRRLAGSKLTPAMIQQYANRPEADPVAVNAAAREIYARLPGRILVQLQSIARWHGQNRHGRRATAAILNRYFKGEAANRRKYAARKANMLDARIRPGDRGPLRKAAEYEAELVAAETAKHEHGDHVTELSGEGDKVTT